MTREHREREKPKIKSEILDMSYLKLVVSVLSKFLGALLPTWKTNFNRPQINL